MPATANSNPLRIIIADPETSERNSLISIFKDEKDFQIIGATNTGKKLIGIVQQFKPDIVITEIELPEISAIESVSIINKLFHSTGIIAFSFINDGRSILGMMKAGVSGYLEKSAHPNELFTAIKTIKNKGNYYCASTANKLIKYLTSSRKREEPEVRISEKESLVMNLICKQHSNKEIAALLQTSLKSVECTRERIQGKIGAINMAGIVVYAIKHNFFSAEQYCPRKTLHRGYNK